MQPILAALSPIERDGIVAIVILVAAAIVAVSVQRTIFALLAREAKKRDGIFGAIVARAQGPAGFIFPLATVECLLPIVRLPESAKTPSEYLLGMALIAAVAWVVIAVIGLAGDLAKQHYRIDVDDNLQARALETRLDILTRAAVTIVVFLATAAALTTVPAIRTIGATLFASAGLIGLMAGFAARPIFENLVAGIQIALTQPFRIDDVIVIDGQQGRIEKITATYVVVRLWDLRRTIVPLTYFINTPFQNWTYTTANLLGTVMLYPPATVPLDEIRKALERILTQTALWDGKTAKVALTEAKPDALEVRVLVSARNSSDLYELRTFVREQLFGYIRTYEPRLPALH